MEGRKKGEEKDVRCNEGRARNPSLEKKGEKLKAEKEQEWVNWC